MAFTSAFRFSPAARRYVRSTWNWSQVGNFGHKKLGRSPPLSDLKLSVFKKWRLGGLPARFWRPRTRFLRPRGSLLEGSGTIFSRFSEPLGREHAGTDLELEAKAARFQLGAPVARAHSSYPYVELQPRIPERKVGGGGPPWGSSMELAILATKN